MRASPIVLLAPLCIPNITTAHHSVSAQFDRDHTVEIEGEVTRVNWQNPHVRFTVSVPDEDGEATLWVIESTSVSTLRRMDISAELVVVGDRVRIAGNLSRTQPREIYVNNLLLPDGQEVVMTARAAPRWTEQSLGTTGPGFVTSGGGSDPSRGLFRVWSTPFSVPILFPENVDFDFDFERYPLTAAARASLAAWDQATDNPTLNCAAKGMPTIMEQPFPMEFVDTGDVILLRLEEYDLIRMIHMKSGATPAEEVATPLGVSTGRWEGRALVVLTDRINWPHFDTVGIPLSEAARLVERFTPSVDGDRLDYELTVTDPATFTQPVTLAKHWVWIPGVDVGIYACVVAGSLERAVHSEDTVGVTRTGIDRTS